MFSRAYVYSEKCHLFCATSRHPRWFGWVRNSLGVLELSTELDWGSRLVKPILWKQTSETRESALLCLAFFWYVWNLFDFSRTQNTCDKWSSWFILAMQQAQRCRSKLFAIPRTYSWSTRPRKLRTGYKFGPQCAVLPFSAPHRGIRLEDEIIDAISTCRTGVDGQWYVRCCWMYDKLTSAGAIGVALALYILGT